jgi:hypothetical protein
MIVMQLKMFQISKAALSQPGIANNFLVSCIAVFEITIYLMFHREEAPTATTAMQFPNVSNCYCFNP